MMASGFRKRARNNQLHYQVKQLTAMVVAQSKIIAEYKENTPGLTIVRDAKGVPLGTEWKNPYTQMVEEEE